MHYALSVAVTLALALGCGASETFEKGVLIPVHANKVGPFSNPSETYPFYSMPFCQPETLVYEDLDLGQILRGDRFVNTKFDLAFAGNSHNRLMCHKTLTQEDQIKLKHAIDADYYFELVVDELPLFGFIGEKEVIEEDGEMKAPQTDSQYFVFTHLDFAFYYSDEHQIVDANISTDQRYRAEIAGKHEGQTDVTFTYSVTWQPSDIHHSHRVEKYSMSGFRQQHMQIHWISIVNSCVLVILLTGFLALILLRILRNDISKIVEFDEEEGDKGDEDCGWKKISGDVFRPPPYPMLLSSLLGMGSQILVLVFSIIALTSIGVIYPHARGAMHSNFIVVFAFTAGVAGFVAAYTYKKLGGDQERQWVWNVVLAGSLFPLPFFAVAMFNNSVAWSNGSTQALPFVTIMQVFFSWLLISMPITVLGGFAGRRMGAPLNPPCRTTKVPREIPPATVVRHEAIQLTIAGFLPFSAIYIEMHYLFASIWGFKLYTLYSVLLLIFFILLLVTSFLTVALIYFQLAAEDHRWWWRSFASGAAPGIFVYAYCFVYFFKRSEMYGFHQGSFFFGYMAMACYAFSTMLGVVGFFSAFIFVSYIYRAIKSD